MEPPGSVAALAKDNDQPSALQRLPLPEGTLPVGVGLLVNGISSYAFFKIGKSALGEVDFKPISSLWFATFFLAPGFFIPLEQELGRSIAQRRARGQGGLPLVRRVLPLALILAALVTLIILIASGQITDRFFDGDWVVTAALLIGFLAYLPGHIARGICAGHGRFSSYGIVIGFDGATKIIGCTVLWASGVKAIGAYAMVVALAPLLGFFVVMFRRDLGADPGPEASWSEVTPNLGWLLAGSVVSAGLVNAGPIMLDLFEHGKGDAAAQTVTWFGSGVLLGRIPLFMFQAVQAALLPRLAGLAGAGKLDEFRHGLRNLLLVVAGVAAAGALGAAAIGPTLLEKAFQAHLETRTITMLALGSGIYMIALTFAQAVIALHGHSLVALGWLVGLVTFVLVVWLSSHDALLRVELALVASSVAAALSFALALRMRLAAGVAPDLGSLVEAAVDHPYEA
ncbi:MAG: hypothetical protein JWM34_791 [Ilumatobacteraceae bacterium]|nr:hypothetical protein [Ilumatobacteraceae bacterium]